MDTPFTRRPVTWFKKRSERIRKAWELSRHIDDLHAAFEERENEGALTKHERELLENALAFSQIAADDVAVTRADIISLPDNADFAATLAAFTESNHSRLLVQGKDMDDVKGFVMLKDFVKFFGKEPTFKLADILRPATFVPESMALPKILQIMRKNRVPLVIAVDEFGGTSGLICLHDILQELVGDIEDEHNVSDDTPMVALGGGRYRVQGDFSLEDFDAAVGTDLAHAFEGQVETLAGAVMQVARKLPAKGEKIKLHADVESTVLQADGRRVLALEIHVKQV